MFHVILDIGYKIFVYPGDQHQGRAWPRESCGVPVVHETGQEEYSGESLVLNQDEMDPVVAVSTSPLIDAAVAVVFSHGIAIIPESRQLGTLVHAPFSLLPKKVSEYVL